MRVYVAFVLLLGCAGAADDPIAVEPAPCQAPPAGFIAWQSGELVNVSKKLSGRAPGGIQLQAEVRHVDAAALPARVDFGDELIEVHPDLSLCLLDR